MGNLPEENARKSKDEEEDVAGREGPAEVVEETAVLLRPLLNEPEENKDREELVKDIQSVDEKYEVEKTFSLEENSSPTSDSTFMIYDNLNERFDQLENIFENKSDNDVEREAFDYDPLTGEITIVRKDDLEHRITISC
eukprot:TRINITY_DN16762_c0_g1_i1.p1 TRINITY_DN16762_c0_g1~~TRINITY_DN16762_c0_g1_i1.p1  ORF type:complete len:147 (-),score=60.01 TRINITY_DN16762_c0_g1_i1:353-769(-)